jgi:hypothetical protein
MRPEIGHGLAEAQMSYSNRKAQTLVTHEDNIGTFK